ncbi:hypothetical protein [Amycolatopsis sp. H20-H5]|uniref:hypothetical protein n=1 Tax=Amycolatopsis sp. H20-H5 TaxID=3046309 RepID=UPI002DBAB0D5|nr:hypothetical protein [Amycolatopsis sp. H20-H5]MEC3978650.1 hypothetical protein [Amycolatopsis sp. H20-H5]
MSKTVKLLLASAATLGCLFVAGSPASAAENTAAAAPSCKFDISFARNAIAARCASGPGTEFAAAIQCTNSSTIRLGPFRKYGVTASAVGCLGSGTIVGNQYGVVTR